MQVHQRHLVELGVPVHVVSDIIAEVTSALLRAHREALWCRNNLARSHWSQYRPFLSPRAHITQTLTNLSEGSVSTTGGCTITTATTTDVADLLRVGQEEGNSARNNCTVPMDDDAASRDCAHGEAS